MVLMDRVVGPLSEETGRLDLLPLARADDVSAPRSGGGVAPWADGWHLVPSRVRVLDEPLERLPADTYDYVVFPHSAIRFRGVIHDIKATGQHSHGMSSLTKPLHDLLAAKLHTTEMSWRVEV